MICLKRIEEFILVNLKCFLDVLCRFYFLCLFLIILFLFFFIRLFLNCLILLVFWSISPNSLSSYSLLGSLLLLSLGCWSIIKLDILSACGASYILFQPPSQTIQMEGMTTFEFLCFVNFFKTYDTRTIS